LDDPSSDSTNESAVDSWITNAQNAEASSYDDIMPVADNPDNRDSVTIKMASQMPSDVLLAYHGITIEGQDHSLAA
jgi:hypothetical protein